MSRALLAMLAISAVFVGAILLTTVKTNQSQLLRLEGEITDVRIEKMSDGANLVFLTFDVINPSKHTFEVQRVEVAMGPKDHAIGGGVLSKREVSSFIDFKKWKDQYPPIGGGDVIAGQEKITRMVAARFEKDQDLNANFRIRFHDLNGVVVDITSQAGQVTLKIKVTPGAPRTEFAGEMADGTLKVRVAAPPEKGKANAELCGFLARHYGVARAQVEVVSGHSVSRKLVRIGLAPSSSG